MTPTMLRTVALGSLLAAAAAADIKVTPWCANSVRLQISDAATDTIDVAARRRELRAAMEHEGVEGMEDI